MAREGHVLEGVGCNMLKMLLLCSLVAFLVSCVSAGSNIPDPHGHVVDVHKKPWSVLESHDIKFVLVERPPDAKKESIVLNQSKSFRAYVTKRDSGEGAGQDLVWIEDLKGGQTYEIQGIPLSDRPLSDLKWVEDEFLVFDRWSNPHYGIHYVVNAIEKKVAIACPFPDQF